LPRNQPSTVGSPANALARANASKWRTRTLSFSRFQQSRISLPSRLTKSLPAGTLLWDFL
jgi:hypothetical protein